MKIKLAGLVFSVVCASQAAATTFDQLYVFGDSTVDSGWWSGARTGQCDGVTAPCATGNAARI